MTSPRFLRQLLPPAFGLLARKGEGYRAAQRFTV